MHIHTSLCWVPTGMRSITIVADRGMFVYISEVSRLVMQVDTFWYVLVRLHAIWSRLVKFRWHDVSWSCLPFRYNQICSDRIVPIESTFGSRPGKIIMSGVPDLVRADTLGYVPIRSSRTDALCCDRIWFGRAFTIMIESAHKLSYD